MPIQKFKDCNIPEKICGKSDYNGVNEKKGDFLKNVKIKCENLKKNKDIEPLWDNPTICITNLGKSVAGNHIQASKGKERKNGKFGAPKSKSKKHTSTLTNSKLIATTEIRERRDRGGGSQGDSRRGKGGGGSQGDAEKQRKEAERIKREEAERIKREEQMKNNEKYETFRQGFVNETVCWGGEAYGTKEILKGEYELASSNDHIYKLLKKKKDGTYEYYPNDDGPIHISVHHSIEGKEGKPTKIHLKLGSSKNKKIREFSTVKKNGKINDPCKGKMYKESKKKLNRYEKVCNVLWNNWVTEHSIKYLGSQEGSFKNNFGFPNNGETSVSVGNEGDAATVPAVAFSVPVVARRAATVLSSADRKLFNSVKTQAKKENPVASPTPGVFSNAEEKPVASPTPEVVSNAEENSVASPTPGVFSNAEEKNLIKEGIGNSEYRNESPGLGKISKKKSKSIKGKTSKGKKGSKTSKGKKGSKTNKGKKGSKNNKGSKKKSSRKEVYNSWKDGSDVYKNTKGFYIFQYNPKKNLEYKKYLPKKYLPNYSKTKKGKIETKTKKN